MAKNDYKISGISTVSLLIELNLLSEPNLCSILSKNVFRNRIHGENFILRRGLYNFFPPIHIHNYVNRHYKIIKYYSFNPQNRKNYSRSQNFFKVNFNFIKL